MKLSCGRCTFLNDDTAMECEMCGSSFGSTAHHCGTSSSSGSSSGSSVNGSGSSDSSSGRCGGGGGGGGEVSRPEQVTGQEHEEEEGITVSVGVKRKLEGEAPHMPDSGGDDNDDNGGSDGDSDGDDGGGGCESSGVTCVAGAIDLADDTDDTEDEEEEEEEVHPTYNCPNFGPNDKLSMVSSTLSSDGRTNYSGSGGKFKKTNPSSDVLQNGLIPLLEEALLQQHSDARAKPSAQISRFRLCSALTPHVTQRGVQEGVHWSCGYRNIQMLCHTLQRMFGRGSLHNGELDGNDIGFFGSGDVPDVAGLQIWIERAWKAGFDRMGAEQFGDVLFGTDEWIGATECAALLRYLGLQANIVDFHVPKLSKPGKSMGLDSPVVRWVKDYFDFKHPFLQQPLSVTYLSGASNVDNKIASGAGSDNISGGHEPRALAGYRPASPSLPPLYFQHQGHSRTIIGYEQYNSKFSLLLFDPASSGSKLRVKLEQQIGWQCMIKRSAQTLTQGQFQIVYVSPGELLQKGSPAYENGKVLTSTVFM